ALQPFGYYSPTVEVERDRDTGRVVITVELGPAVRVRDSNVTLVGEAEADRDMTDAVAAFKPSEGEVFDSILYDTSKALVSRRLAERGYFDAELERHRVEVTRSEQAADIDLLWTSGARHAMGEVDFTQSPEIIRPQLLEKLVSWE